MNQVIHLIHRECQINSLPIHRYIVDFIAPRVTLIIEVDGGQHYDAVHLQYDGRRDAYLTGLGYEVLRFTNLEVLQLQAAVLEKIYTRMQIKLERF